MTPKVVAIMPAFNEESSIARSIEAVLAQTVPVKLVVVPNGCTDETAAIARSYPVTVMELPKLKHKKSEAMNRAWLEHCQDADYVITVDADTLLAPTSVAEWLEEFKKDPLLAGSSARFTMRGNSFIERMQRLDFSIGVDISLHRGWTGVLAGAGSCFHNGRLSRLMEFDGREGPWTYDSAVEDLEVTYRLRRTGLRTIVSPKVRAYTDPMKTWRALRGQRLKWQTGTIEDLISYGWNRHTFVMWAQQARGLGLALVMLLFLTMMTAAVLFSQLRFSWWWLVIPVIGWFKNVKHASRVPDRDWVDLLMGGSIVIYEIFSWTLMAWFVTAWVEVLWSKATKKKKDRWQLQYAAEMGK